MSANEEQVQLIARLLRHRDSFAREQWLEDCGWQVKPGVFTFDGYLDPLTNEVLDAETAFTVAQTRDILNLMG